jgi:peptidoglycan hydrolase-like protein with peptidoglycan-binding domain
VSGYYGPKTLAAVKRFQEKYGITKEGDPGYGILGPKTRAKIKELSGSSMPVPSTSAPVTPSTPPSAAPAVSLTRTLSSGSQGTDVTSLQQFLASDPTVYPEGIVSGYYGPKTLAAIQRFQEKYGIASLGQTGYGVVGPKTRAKIHELSGSSMPVLVPVVPLPAGTPAPASSSPSIEDLQKQLKALEDMLKQLQPK